MFTRGFCMRVFALYLSYPAFLDQVSAAHSEVEMDSHTTCPSLESPCPLPLLPLLVRLFSECQPPLATFLNLSMVWGESQELGVVNVFTDSGTENSGPMISSGQALG